MLIAFPFSDFFLWFWYWFWFSNVYLIRLNRGSIRFGFDSMRDLIDVPTNWSISIVIIKIVHSWFHSFVPSHSLTRLGLRSISLSISPLSLHSIVTLSFIRIDLLLSSCIPFHRCRIASQWPHWRWFIDAMRYDTIIGSNLGRNFFLFVIVLRCSAFDP